MINNEIRKRIEQKFGATIKYPKDCAALSNSIYKHSKKQISITTLKRLFGFVNQVEQPHRHTLDVLAHYAGLRDWEELKKCGKKDSNSSFFQVKGIESESLSKGNNVEFTYDPGRKVILNYKGNNMYKVISSENSKLQTGDIIYLTRIFLNYPLIATEVIRKNKSLGKFTAGKANGITSINIVE